jgi:hypothetical protein
MDKKIGIYKITNPQGKIYIGQSNDIYHRFYSYKKLNCKGQIKLYNSLLKYGVDDHQFEIIEECLSEQLDEKEKQYKTDYVNQYGWDKALFLMLEDAKGGNKNNSTIKKMALSSIKITRAINVYDLNGNFINNFPTATHANQILFPGMKILTGDIFKSCNRGKQKTHRGYIFQFADDDKIDEVVKGLSNNIKIKQKKVIQYDLEGNIIKEYLNSYQASKEFEKLGIRLNSSDIRACCEGRQKTAKGFKWVYGDSLIEHMKIKNVNYIEKKKQEFQSIEKELIYDKSIQNKSKELIIPFINSLGIHYETQYNNEIDFYFPKYKLGINIYDLKELINMNYNHMINLKKKYLINDIKLLQLFSDEIINKFHITFSRIKNEFNINHNIIYARKCVVKEITDIQLKNNFLNNNHIQGGDKSKIKLGLYYMDELVSLMTFNHPRINIGSTSIKFSKNNWELLRFCSKIDYHVIGGASKLFTYFVKKYNPHIIHSFADNRWSSPLKNVYNSIGFNYISESSQGYYYTKDFTTRYHRFNFNKQRLKSEGYDTDHKTELEIMKERGYHRIWDCGVTRYEYINPFHK